MKMKNAIIYTSLVINVIFIGIFLSSYSNRPAENIIFEESVKQFKDTSFLICQDSIEVKYKFHDNKISFILFKHENQALQQLYFHESGKFKKYSMIRPIGFDNGTRINEIESIYIEDDNLIGSLSLSSYEKQALLLYKDENGNYYDMLSRDPEGEPILVKDSSQNRINILPAY
jgi:hypothetical protein